MVVKDVPDDCTVVGVPGRIVTMAGVRVDMKDALDHNKLPDIEMQRIIKLEEDIARLRKELDSIRKEKQ